MIKPSTSISHGMVTRHADPRGFVFEPLDGECLLHQKNVHVVVSRPNAVRGNHYHRVGTETLAVCGPARVCIRREAEIVDLSIPADSIWRLTIPPGVSHAIQNTGSTDSLLVAFNTQPHNPESPDWVEDILIPA